MAASSATGSGCVTPLRCAWGMPWRRARASASDSPLLLMTTAGVAARRPAAQASTTACRTLPRCEARTPSLTPRSGPEDLDEPLADLLALLLQLLGIGGQQLQVRELGPVGRVLHLGVAGVEPLAVGHHLLDLAAEREVGEELGGVGVRREAHDRGRRHDERHALLRIDDLDGISLLLDLVERVV